MINYEEILNQNLKNVLIEILKNIEKNSLKEGNHLYITLLTNHPNNSIPKWLKDKHPSEITIVIQHEFYNLKVKKNNFLITLSFNDKLIDLDIDYNSIVSFADPFANFGLKLINSKNTYIGNKAPKKKVKKEKKNNVIDLANYKKN